MDDRKALINKLTGVFGFAAPTIFAWTVYANEIPQNIATWSMIMFLDLLGLILVYKGGNKKPFLQLGWFAASLLILAAIFFGDSPWHWGATETISLILCGIAILLWQTLDVKYAIWAYCIALFISGVPLMTDYWSVPQPETLWLWVVTVFTCSLSVYAAEKRDIAHTAVPWTAIVLNSLIGILCLL